jgi:hypothetical protein
MNARGGLNRNAITENHESIEFLTVFRIIVIWVIVLQVSSPTYGTRYRYMGWEPVDRYNRLTQLEYVLTNDDKLDIDNEIRFPYTMNSHFIAGPQAYDRNRYRNILWIDSIRLHCHIWGQISRSKKSMTAVTYFLRRWGVGE